jgi:hypothetical protein
MVAETNGIFAPRQLLTCQPHAPVDPGLNAIFPVADHSLYESYNMPLILHVPQHNLINKNNIELKVSH